MDHSAHADHGRASDPHAGHKMSDLHEAHDRHAGHSVAMFRDKFWLSFALTIPVVFWSADVQHWLGYTAPSFPGSSFIPPLIFGYGGVVFLRGAAGELADRTPGMMTLVSLAILVPFATSLAATFGIFEIDVWWVERRIALRRRPRRPRPTSRRRGANPCLDRRDLIFERGPQENYGSGKSRQEMIADLHDPSLPDGCYPFIDERLPLSDMTTVEAPPQLEALFKTQAEKERHRNHSGRGSGASLPIARVP